MKAVPISDIKVGVTAAADHVRASKDYTPARVGTGVTGAATAKDQSRKNKKDDLVLVAGPDVYRLSASKLSSPRGKMPAVDEMMTVFDATGKEVQGVVVHVDHDRSQRGRGSAKGVGGGIEVTQFIFSHLIKALSSN
ncbi:MAG: hypothetical protein H7338_16800 [Candidatus Sericytochromatia bacterium]|nr:hypothetical protein [Candidatus Sericytochromatia bacterium]